jgi:hypothetical protein
MEGVALDHLSIQMEFSEEDSDWIRDDPEGIFHCLESTEVVSGWANAADARRDPRSFFGGSSYEKPFEEPLALQNL